jgi:hypothetical protein
MWTDAGIVNGNREVRVVINPETIIEVGEDDRMPNEMLEGCLSIPGVLGRVTRCHEVGCVYWDEKGQRHEETLRGMEARIYQQERGNLVGMLFVDLADKFYRPESGRGEPVAVSRTGLRSAIGARSDMVVVTVPKAIQSSRLRFVNTCKNTVTLRLASRWINDFNTITAAIAPARRAYVTDEAHCQQNRQQKHTDKSEEGRTLKRHKRSPFSLIAIGYCSVDRPYE